MKIVALFILLFLSGVQMVLSQEICDNALDDDGDGLIDLNDTDCDCDNLIDLSLIPNPSFEDTLCCPTSEAMLSCATSWIQASAATSDFYHFCGIDELAFDGAVPPEVPLPGGGEGFIGLYNFLTGYREYAGVCTSGPLLAGVSYSLNFHTAYAFGDEDELEVNIFGSPTCFDLPWFGVGCPDGTGLWELLVAETVVYPMDGSWQNVTVTFTPPVNMNAIALGGPCGDIGDTDGSYFYFDELILLDSETMGYIEEDGGWCSGDLVLTAMSGDPGGTWQWYKDGVALLGETSADLSPVPYGEGTFTALYTYADGCKQIHYTSPGIPTADFDFESVCLGDPVVFENLSTISGGDGGDIDSWFWDFDDLGTSDLENPTHIYLTDGVYSVDLVAYSEDPSCNDTINRLVTVFPVPEPDFSITGDGVSESGGNWFACANSELFFTDLTTIDGPISLASWSWDFGDGSTSSDQNPTHTFTTAGTSDITLTVVSENGCVGTINEDIILIDVTADFTSNDSVCEGTPVYFGNTSNSSDGNPITNWRWYFGDGGDTVYVENPSCLYGSGGNFETELYVENALGCKDSISKTVVVHLKPNPNFYAENNPTDYFNTYLRLTMIYPNSDSDYEWFMPGGTPATSNQYAFVYVTYPEFVSADYEVTLIETSEFGCKDTVRHIIQVMEDQMVFAPNTFTPNGDPINPDWGVYVEGLRLDDNQFILTVFNRWGEIIWQTNDPTDRWDGTSINGNLVLDDTYVWYIKARDQINDEVFEFTGFVTVLK